MIMTPITVSQAQTVRVIFSSKVAKAKRFGKMATFRHTLAHL